jgi:hypothetical protein
MAYKFNRRPKRTVRQRILTVPERSEVVAWADKIVANGAEATLGEEATPLGTLCSLSAFV